MFWLEVELILRVHLSFRQQVCSFLGGGGTGEVCLGDGVKEGGRAGSVSPSFIHPSGDVFFCMSSLWSPHSHQTEKGPEGHWSKPY